MDMSTVESVRTRCEGGRELHAWKWGTGTPDVVLIHGFGDGGFIWRSVVERLQTQGAILAPDLRGHGESCWDAEGRYETDGFVADIRGMWEKVPWHEAVLVGHSLGAEVAVYLAATLPQAVRSLVLLDGGPTLNLEKGRYVRRMFEEQPWSYDSRAEYLAYLRRRLPFAAAAALHIYAESAVAAHEASPGRCTLKCDPAICRSPEPRDKGALRRTLSSLQCPITVVRGALSAVLGRHRALELCSGLRSARLVEIPRAGHNIMLDNPAALAKALQEVLDDSRA